MSIQITGYIRVKITILQSFCAAAISNPYSVYRLFRNPKEETSGKLLSLSEFLNLAKNSTTLSGVLISVEVSSRVLLSLRFYQSDGDIFSWPRHNVFFVFLRMQHT